jgi:hypothetical protein
MDRRWNWNDCDEDHKFVDNFSPDGREVYYGRNLGRDEIWAVPALGGSPRRVASAGSVLPSSDGTSLFFTKSDSPAIFRVGTSGLNEELVYKPEGTDLFFFPVLLFPGGNDLLVLAGRPNLNIDRIFKLNVASHEAVELGEKEYRLSTPVLRDDVPAQKPPRNCNYETEISPGAHYVCSRSGGRGHSFLG